MKNMTRYKILIAEKNDADFLGFKNLLSETSLKHQLVRAKNNNEFLSLLDEDAFDLIFAEYFPEENNGQEQLKIAISKNSFIPVIALGQNLHNGSEVEVLRAGASDIIDKKNISVNELERSVKNSIARQLYFKKLTGNENYNNRLKSLAEEMRNAHMLAHEIRNPLSRIILSVEKAKEFTTADSEANFYLDMISQGGKEIDKLMHDLTSITMSEITMQKQDLISVVKEAVVLVAPYAGSYSISVSEHYEPESIAIDVDVEKLKSALLHILHNAVDAVKENKGEIDVEVVKKHNQAIIRIRDSGCGMSNETLEKIFTPFFSLKSKAPGLGLTQAKNIIFRHKGTIEVNSEIGKGSEFILTFPLD